MNHTSHHDESDHRMVESESSVIEYLKFAAITTFIAVIAWVLRDQHGFMEAFMGVFFATFAGFKFVGYAIFAEMFAMYDLIAARSKVYARAYPYIELGFGLAYLLGIGGVARDVIVALVMLVGAAGVWREVKSKSGMRCACLGNVIKLPLSSVTLTEDLVMGAMAAWLVAERIM